MKKNTCNKVLNKVSHYTKNVVAFALSAAVADTVATTVFNECETVFHIIDSYNATTMIKNKKKFPWSKQTYTEVYLRNGKPVKGGK